LKDGKYEEVKNTQNIKINVVTQKEQ